MNQSQIESNNQEFVHDIFLLIMRNLDRKINLKKVRQTYRNQFQELDLVVNTHQIPDDVVEGHKSDVEVFRTPERNFLKKGRESRFQDSSGRARYIRVRRDHHTTLSPRTNHNPLGERNRNRTIDPDDKGQLALLPLEKEYLKYNPLINSLQFIKQRNQRYAMEKTPKKQALSRRKMMIKGTSKPNSFLMMPKMLQKTPDKSKSMLESKDCDSSSANCDFSATKSIHSPPEPSNF